MFHGRLRNKHGNIPCCWNTWTHHVIWHPISHINFLDIILIPSLSDIFVKWCPLHGISPITHCGCVHISCTSPAYPNTWDKKAKQKKTFFGNLTQHLSCIFCYANSPKRSMNSTSCDFFPSQNKKKCLNSPSSHRVTGWSKTGTVGVGHGPQRSIYLK